MRAMKFGHTREKASKILGAVWRALYASFRLANGGCRDNLHRAAIARSPILAIERRPIIRKSFHYQKFVWCLPAATKTGAVIGAALSLRRAHGCYKAATEDSARAAVRLAGALDKPRSCVILSYDSLTCCFS